MVSRVGHNITLAHIARHEPGVRSILHGVGSMRLSIGVSTSWPIGNSTLCLKMLCRSFCTIQHPARFALYLLTLQLLNLRSRHYTTSELIDEENHMTLESYDFEALSWPTAANALIYST